MNVYKDHVLRFLPQGMQVNPLKHILGNKTYSKKDS